MYLVPPTAPVSWRNRALCTKTDPEVWFPEKGRSPRPAKRICGLCEVREACLEFALEHNIEFGVYGGLTRNERLSLRRSEAA